MTSHRDVPGHRQWYRPRSIVRSFALRPRVSLAVLTVLAAVFLLPPTVSGNLRTALAADAGALVYLALSFRIMLACGRDVMRKRAEKQDDRRW